LLTVLITAHPAIAKENKEARDFFKQYITLCNNIDIEIRTLYFDDARIHASLHTAQGLERILDVTGAQWKELIVELETKAKEKGYISEYRNVTISQEADTIRIKADRHSVLKCFTDKKFYLVIKRDENNKFKILEEYMETKRGSDCKNI
jgi:hypothetical protein